MKKIAQILILSALVYAISCNQRSENFDNGEINDNHYTNDFFGLNITYNDSWIAQDESINEKLVFMCIKLIANGDEKMMVNLIKEMRDNAILLNLRNVNDTSSIVVFAEKDTGFSWKPTNMDTYIHQVKSLIDNTPIGFKFIDESDTIKSKWNLLQTQSYLNNRTLRQDFFIHKKNGYFITLISTYCNEKQEQQNKQIISKVKL